LTVSSQDWFSAYETSPVFASRRVRSKNTANPSRIHSGGSGMKALRNCTKAWCDRDASKSSALSLANTTSSERSTVG
jgi:hypothetical protein